MDKLKHRAQLLSVCNGLIHDILPTCIANIVLSYMPDVESNVIQYDVTLPALKLIWLHRANEYLYQYYANKYKNIPCKLANIYARYNIGIIAYKLLISSLNRSMREGARMEIICKRHIIASIVAELCYQYVHSSEPYIIQCLTNIDFLYKKIGDGTLALEYAISHGPIRVIEFIYNRSHSIDDNTRRVIQIVARRRNDEKISDWLRSHLLLLELDEKTSLNVGIEPNNAERASDPHRADIISNIKAAVAENNQAAYDLCVSSIHPSNEELLTYVYATVARDKLYHLVGE